jgi:alpha-beta hydrolase superfamily lysophospholipase
MSATPTWFGPEEQPLFGWLHLPENGQARAAMVLCPAIGTEEMSAYAGMRILAEQLAAQGILALRFDYRCTGNSAGTSGDPGEILGWLDSVKVAIAYIRSCGVSSVGLVGLRMGGTLAGLAASQDDAVAALVLWDPCVSGKSFLREQQALKAAAIGEPPDEGVNLPVGSVEILGAVFDASARADLESLDLGTLERLPAPTLVLLRDNRPIPRGLRPIVSGEHAGVEVGTAAGQSEFVDVVPDDSQLPVETLDAISSWADRVLGGVPVRVTPTVRSVAKFPGEIIERAVQFGPQPLFGIVTELESPTTAGGPTIVLLNAGILHHAGPSRLWVTLARRFAKDGLRVLRFDLNGLGDSYRRPGPMPLVPWRPNHAIDDIRIAVTEVTGSTSDGTPNAVLAGLCSGAYLSIAAGIELGALGVCAINPILSFDPAATTDTPGTEVAVPFNPMILKLRRIKWLAGVSEYRVPPSVWWVLDRLGIQKNPARGLERLMDTGAPTLLLCGETEARPFQRRAKWSMRRLERSGQLRFEILRSIDHTLFGASARERAIRVITAYILSTFPPDGGLAVPPSLGSQAMSQSDSTSPVGGRSA